jgi:TatD DNase family protein
MLIDTHAHLWWPSFAKAPAGKDSLESVLQRALAAGVEKMIVPGTNIESSIQAIELAKKYPGTIYPAVGIHPEDVEGAQVDKVKTLIAQNKELVVAVGEIGIDMYSEKEKQSIEAQKVLFKAQCELAIELDLPVIIHTRDSFEQTWEVLSSLPMMPRGQFHCFSVDEAALDTVVKAGFYVSFCGNIMYSKRVAKLVALVPDTQLLLETDSPFMQPGARNEPAYTKILAEKVAELRETTLKKVEELTTDNANRIYRL